MGLDANCKSLEIRTLTILHQATNVNDCYTPPCERVHPAFSSPRQQPQPLGRISACQNGRLRAAQVNCVPVVDALGPTGSHCAPCKKASNHPLVRDHRASPEMDGSACPRPLHAWQRGTSWTSAGVPQREKKATRDSRTTPHQMKLLQSRLLPQRHRGDCSS